MNGVKSNKKTDLYGAATLAPAAESMLAALPDAVMAVTGDIIIYANHAAMDFTGLGEKALRAQSLPSVFGPAHPVCQAVQTVAAGGQNLTLRDIDLCQRPAARLSLSALPEMPQTVLLSWTVDRLPLQSEWLTQQRTVMKPAQDMARMLAHEIKNPLAGIRGAAQLLQKSAADDDDRALATLIDSETQRILRLLAKVNAFDDVAVPENFAPVNLHGVTDHVMDCARAGFAAGCSLRADYDPSLPDIDGHADALVQAVMNIVKNAAEAGAKDILLRTSFDVAPQYHPETGRRLPLILSIEDDGAGMSDETAARLFEPCYTTKQDGEGFGLVIVSRIIDAHGGMIGVARKGGRTSFRLSFPLPPRRKEKSA
jgi:two-component system nitrogen regulation sensor histidine kinase GlnL